MMNVIQYGHDVFFFHLWFSHQRLLSFCWSLHLIFWVKAKIVKTFLHPYWGSAELHCKHVQYTDLQANNNIW